jgi:ammonia channel protein AmtB
MKLYEKFLMGWGGFNVGSTEEDTTTSMHIAAIKTFL